MTALSALTFALSVALLVQTRRLRHARQSADWNAALATRARAAMQSMTEQLRETGRRLEARFSRE